jgi:hypothetical protein
VLWLVIVCHRSWSTMHIGYSISRIFTPLRLEIWQKLLKKVTHAPPLFINSCRSNKNIIPDHSFNVWPEIVSADSGCNGCGHCCVHRSHALSAGIIPSDDASGNVLHTAFTSLLSLFGESLHVDCRCYSLLVCTASQICFLLVLENRVLASQEERSSMVTWVN